ncbi:acylphosphatase [Nocardioides mesophilus]|uniref:Acylphosphatase n=1 Tax=Nocardioides mesophilus TaxID=433659 RepID=A0A7G9RF11_9ACTN|nr:acylphosphatase [Nocardioides mesophilus]QNN54186.1 acylphosphatase [Nocardioides mesophilus]
MSRELIARRLRIHGLVQGVGFRFYCQREAHRLGVTGWVRNENDGTVAACFEGPPSAVEALVEWCRHGPGHAAVDRVDVHDDVPSGADRFQVG